MTYQPLHRRPRWHDRPRAWLRGLLDTISGREEEQVLTDDHGNHIGQDLPPVQRWPVPEDRVYQAARLGDGTLLPVDGEPAPAGYNPVRVNPAFTPDVPRSAPGPSGQIQSGHGPGYRQNVPWPGARRAESADNGSDAGPGHLSMWDLIPVRSPWQPRTWPAVLSGPRICAGRITLLAGA